MVSEFMEDSATPEGMGGDRSTSETRSQSGGVKPTLDLVDIAPASAATGNNTSDLNQHSHTQSEVTGDSVRDSDSDKDKDKEKEEDKLGSDVGSAGRKTGATSGKWLIFDGVVCTVQDQPASVSLTARNSKVNALF